MGCCISKDDPWDMDFTETELSSNKCDAIWETVRGLEATFGMGQHHAPCARFGISEGVIRCQVGFCGGTSPNPSYEDIGDHTLAINVEYDPSKISYEQLLQIFFTYHDIFLRSEKPENRSTIFYCTNEEKATAEKIKADEQAKHAYRVVTAIVPFNKFVSSPDEKQHYILQSNQEVMEKLGDRINLTQIGYSHLAGRLEGYIAGYSTPEEFDKELPDLYIPKHLSQLVKKICRKNQILEPGSDHINDRG